MSLPIVKTPYSRHQVMGKIVFKDISLRISMEKVYFVVWGGWRKNE